MEEKGFSVIYFLIVVAIISGGIIGGSLYMKQYKPVTNKPSETTKISSTPVVTNSPQPIKTIQSTTTPSSMIQPIVISGWQSYTSKFFNITFQYPPDWKLDSHIINNKEILTITPSATGLPYIGIGTPSVPNYKGSDLTVILDSMTGKNVPQTTVSVAGKQGAERKNSLASKKEGGGQDNFVYLLFMNSKERIISVELQSFTKNDSDDNYYAVFDKLVSTIKELYQL